MVTALATGVGALPLLIAGRVPARWLGIANGAAAGLMAAASWSLIQEGLVYGAGGTAGGVLAGVVFILLSSRLLAGRDVHWGAIEGADALRILLIVGVMTIHSMAEGVGVGVAFGGGESLGLYITIAIAIHNIPEGLAISLVMVPRGASVPRAAAWSIFSSLPQPLLAVPAFLLVEQFRPLLPWGLGFAAGAMLWMVASELLPEARREAGFVGAAMGTVVGAAIMVGLQTLF